MDPNGDDEKTVDEEWSKYARLHAYLIPSALHTNENSSENQVAPDAGTTYYVCRHFCRFKNMRKFMCRKTVLSDDHFVVCVLEGQVTPSELTDGKKYYFTLRNVLHVPNLKRTALSCAFLSKSNCVTAMNRKRRTVRLKKASVVLVMLSRVSSNERGKSCKSGRILARFQLQFCGDHCFASDRRWDGTFDFWRRFLFEVTALWGGVWSIETVLRRKN